MPSSKELGLVTFFILCFSFLFSFSVFFSLYFRFQNLDSNLVVSFSFGINEQLQVQA
jgi:hypothetical protein